SSAVGVRTTSASNTSAPLYVGAWNGTMYALDAFSGQPLWTFNINDPNPGDRGGFPGIQASATVVDGVVYFGAADANVYALDALPGRICGTDTRQACTTDADCSGSSCVPFLVCRSGSGEQTQSQLCASDADCTAPATCQPPLGSGMTSSAAIDAERGAVYADL